MCIADCKYDVVREAAQAKGWKLVNEDPEASTTRKCHVYWIDVPAIVERMQHLHRWQRINHFPGMSNVARKGRLAQNLDRMRRTFPHEYSFYPRTWVLPLEWGAFKSEFDANGKTTRVFIVKPDSGCQGRGIFLTQDLERVDAMESQVAQLYVQRPLLIEGFKFDLRLYVLVTSVIPLRVYAFKDGLTRFCTEEYTRPSGDNLGKRCMHLTNYAVNKGSEKFVANDRADRDDLGSKRSLRWLLGWIASERGGQEKADALWRRMGGAIVKTLVSVMPTLHREYLNTFGADHGARPPGTAGNVDRNGSDPAGGVPNCSGSESLRAAAGATAGSSHIVDTGCRSTGATSQDRGISGPVDALEKRSSRLRPLEDDDVRHAQAASSSGCPSPDEDAENIEALPQEEATRPPRGFGKDGESSRSAEGHRDLARGMGGDTKADLMRGSTDEASETPGCDPSNPSLYATSSNDGDGAYNSRPCAGAGGSEKRVPAAGGRERVVEGSRCVEILGFDFMIDAALKPWLIEVNHLPSFATDSPLDRRIKAQVVSTALSVLHAKADDRQSYEENAKRDAQNRLYNTENLAAGSAQKEKERKDAEAAVAKIRKKLEAIYMRFAPHKLGKVGTLMAKYAGDEEKLLRIVRRKYVTTDRPAAAEEGKSASTPCSDGGHDDLQAADFRQSKTAPVHGGEAKGAVGEHDDGSHEALLKSIANPTVGQISAWDKPLSGNEEDRGKSQDKGDEESPTTWPSRARIPEPPQDRGRGGSAKHGASGREEGPASPSSSRATEQQHLEALSREADILQGWERLHPSPDVATPVGARKPSPPVGPHVDISSGQEVIQERESEVGTGGGGDGGGYAVKDDGGGGGSCGGGDVRERTVKGGRRRRKPAAAVELMIQRAFEDDRKMTLRLRCPLQQQRGVAMDPQVQSTTKLPQVGGLGHFSAGGVTPAAPSTASYQKNNRGSSNRSSPPVVLGPEQREKVRAQLCTLGGMGDINEEDLDLLDLFCDDTPARSSWKPPPQYQRHQPEQSPQRQYRPPSSATSPPSSRHSNGAGNHRRRPNDPPPAAPRTASSPSSSSSSFARTPPPPAGAIKPPTPTQAAPAADFVETFSGLRVRNRLLSADDMLIRMKGRKVHRLAGLRAVPASALQGQDPADAWAALGVLVSKSPRRQAANGGSYSIWTLSDLSRRENDVSVFLFQEALSSHWTVCEGTLVALLSAKVLPDKGGGGNAQRRAFSVDSPWQINRVGMAMDYGLCKGKRKDGGPCTMPVNKAEGGGYCEFHVVAAFNRAQRKDPLRNSLRGGTGSSNGSNSSITNSKLNSTANFLASARQQQHQAVLQRHPTLPGQRPQAPALRTAPTLSGILGEGARRREDVGAARTFGSSSGGGGGGGSGNRTASAILAKPLLPSAMRASGRTTVLSSHTHPPGGASRREGRTTGTSGRSAAAGTATVGGGSAFKEGSAGRAGSGGSRSSNTGGTAAKGVNEDLLQLPWAYGAGSHSGGGPERGSRSRDAPAASSRRASGDKKGAGIAGTAEPNKKKARAGALGTAAAPPKEAHPAGYTDGSVVVPAESKVFLQMPQRFPVRSDGSMTAEGTRALANAEVLRKQRALKHIADSRGVLLRPQDSNAVGGASSKKVLGSARKRVARPGGARSADGLLGAGRRGGDVDPLAKKVKTMSKIEKELLLRRVSKYAGLAEEERAKDADNKMQRLEQREEMADKAEEVTKMAVTVFHCKQCKTRRSRFNKNCRDLGHEQKGIKATLRFFECTNCRKRCSSTERVPQTGCESCGRHNMWKRCGARPGRGPAEGSRDKRFVTAVSEWTDQRDLSLAAPDFR
eukprot:g1823.t1